MHGLDWPAAGVGFGSVDAASWGWSSLPNYISAGQKVVLPPLRKISCAFLDAFLVMCAGNVLVCIKILHSVCQD